MSQWFYIYYLYQTNFIHILCRVVDSYRVPQNSTIDREKGIGQYMRAQNIEKKMFN